MKTILQNRANPKSEQAANFSEKERVANLRPVTEHPDDSERLPNLQIHRSGLSGFPPFGEKDIHAFTESRHGRNRPFAIQSAARLSAKRKSQTAAANSDLVAADVRRLIPISGKEFRPSSSRTIP